MLFEDGKEENSRFYYCNLCKENFQQYQIDQKATTEILLRREEYTGWKWLLERSRLMF